MTSRRARWSADIKGVTYHDVRPDATGSATLARIQDGYDADGNVLSEDNLVETGGSKTFAYDDQDRLIGYAEGVMSDDSIADATTTTWHLDAFGNQISSGSTAVMATMTYNAWNQMTSADVDGTTVDDVNNALGQRIGNITGGVLQEQVYSANGQVIEVDLVGAGDSLTPQTQYATPHEDLL